MRLQLGDVIFLKDTASLLLRAETLHVEAASLPYRASGTLLGEPIDRVRHEMVADVKAVTWYGLRVEHAAGEWHVHATLDV